VSTSSSLSAAAGATATSAAGRALDLVAAAVGERLLGGEARLLLTASSSCLFLRVLSASVDALSQGLTLVHFSAQLEPCLTQEDTLHTLNTP
jgi:hypothetical protein